MTRNQFGKGAAYYLGTRLYAPSMGRLLRRAWSEAGVQPVFATPARVEAVRRVHPGGASFLFLLNHGDDEVELEVTAGSLDLLSGRRSEGSRLRLGPRQVAILDEVSR